MLYSKRPIFRVQSGKNYTGQKFFTQTPSVASVTNMRYGYLLLLGFCVFLKLLCVWPTCLFRLSCLLSQPAATSQRGDLVNKQAQAGFHVDLHILAQSNFGHETGRDMQKCISKNG